MTVGIYNNIKLYFKEGLTDRQLNRLRIISHKLSCFFKVIPSIFLYIKYNNYTAKNYLSIVAIIKNERPYIAEWIEYHLLVGVNKIYIYDNESIDNLQEALEPYIKDGIVEYKYCLGKGKQIWVYNDILKKARKETYWLAVIDCDEFIVPVSKETIPEILMEFGHGDGYGGLGIKWVLYGSSGQQNKKEGLVIERFKDHANENDKDHIKTIVNPRYILFFKNPHSAVYVTWKFCVNPDKEKITGWLSDCVPNKIRINHYFTKSYEEYLQKKQRGKADCIDEQRPLLDFMIHDRNDVKNDSIMDKYIPVIYEKLKERYK